MIEQLNTWLDSTTQMLGKLNGLPGYVLVFLWCIVFGYGLRYVKRFPNDAIPLAVILWGVIWNGLIADPISDKMPFRIWLVKNSVVGGIIGFVAWLVHWQVISRLEEKIPLLRRSVRRQAEGKREHETQLRTKEDMERKAVEKITPE